MDNQANRSQTGSRQTSSDTTTTHLTVRPDTPTFIQAMSMRDAGVYMLGTQVQEIRLMAGERATGGLDCPDCDTTFNSLCSHCTSKSKFLTQPLIGCLFFFASLDAKSHIRSFFFQMKFKPYMGGDFKCSSNWNYRSSEIGRSQLLQVYSLLLAM